ncbi:MAG: cytochrome c family protein [Planctomycetes bacterium]|nr:cytochrome c family protein [Planctomycetota bacterium]
MPRLVLAAPWLALVLVGVGIAAIPFDEPAPTAPLGTVPPPKAECRIPAAGYVGATSCAASNCHGGDPHRAGGEYATWVINDPHTRAYKVLYNEVSEKISKNLEAFRGGKYIPAAQDTLCLKCHSLPLETKDPHERSVFLSQGVSCEACHGPAQHYLSTHFQPDMLALSPHAKAEKNGLYPTKDLAFRATLCASCHLGDANREVNHDLIAAGHPRLMFELSSYLEHPKYGKHWKEKSEPADFGVRSWAVGQAAMLKSSIDLLQSRAERANEKKAPWPEFTEYSCYACHKDLSNKDGNWKDASTWDHAPGKMAWGTWTLPVLRVLAEGKTELTGGKTTSLKSVDELRELMELTPLANDKIIAKCKAARTEINGLLGLLLPKDGSTPPTFTQHNSLFRSIMENGLTNDRKKFNNLDWDGVTQHYLGLTAIYYSWLHDRPDGLKRPLIELKQGLRFPEGFDSPKTAKPAALLKSFQDLFPLTPKPEGRP